MKYIKIITVNICLFIIMLFVLDVICGFIELTKIGVTPSNFIQGYYKYKITEMAFKKKNGIWWYLKEDYIAKPTKKPSNPKIVLLGCSFTYGDGLERKDAFYSVLSRYTNRVVYNFGISGSGPKEFLYLIKSNELKNIVENYPPPSSKNVEYVIYTYINDHKRRIYSDGAFPYGEIYKIKNGNFIHIKENKIKQMLCYLNKPAMNLYWLINNLYKRDWDTMKLYIYEMNKTVKKQFKNGDKDTKFVILVYEDDKNAEKWKVFEAQNIIVINLQLLMPNIVNNEKYRIPNDAHPNKEAWLKIVPEIIKQLHLND